MLICGSGRTLFPDLHSFAELCGAPEIDDVLHNIDAFADVMAINEAYLALETVHHLVSYHDEIIWPLLMLKGPRHTWNGEYRVDTQPRVVCHSQRESKGVDRVWAFEEGGGSSSFFGVQVALEMGYRRIVLCGVPFDATGRFYFPPWRGGHDYKGTDGWEIWQKWRGEGRLKGVRSASGATRELLGEPERDWLWQ